MENNIRYVCYCKAIFNSQKAFRTHNKQCSLLSNIITQTKEVRVVERRVKPKTNIILKVVEQIPKAHCEDETLAENLQRTSVGRRLPSRTKVPFLSRAVPLSTDHSFQRCTCGAVFVTKEGKRQHLARFCSRNKSKSGVSKFRRNSSTPMQETEAGVSVNNPSEFQEEYNTNEQSEQSQNDSDDYVVTYETFVKEDDNNVDDDDEDTRVIEYQEDGHCIIYVNDNFRVENEINATDSDSNLNLHQYIIEPTVELQIEEAREMTSEKNFT